MRQAIGPLAVAACALAGCVASVAQYQRVERTKTAAIVAVAAALNTQNRTQGDGSGTLGAAQEMINLGTEETIAERKVQGNQIYDALVAEIGKSMGWTIKSRDEVVADAANRALYEQEIGTPNSLQLGGIRIYVPGILWTERVRGLTPERRKQLFDSLGVDALIFVDINYYVAKTGPVTWKVGKDGVATISGAIPGTSAAYPAARVSLEVYDAELPQAIWSTSASGEPAQIGIVTTKGIEYKTDLVPILKDALQTAWRALVKEFEAGKAAVAQAPSAS